MDAEAFLNSLFTRWLRSFIPIHPASYFRLLAILTPAPPITEWASLSIRSPEKWFVQFLFLWVFDTRVEHRTEPEPAPTPNALCMIAFNATDEFILRFAAENYRYYLQKPEQQVSYWYILR